MERDKSPTSVKDANGNDAPPLLTSPLLLLLLLLLLLSPLLSSALLSDLVLKLLSVEPATTQDDE